MVQVADAFVVWLSMVEDCMESNGGGKNSKLIKKLHYQHRVSVLYFKEKEKPFFLPIVPHI